MSEGPWEHYTDWWIDGFTDGADPEYVEQIVPMAVAELSGAGTVLDVGCGDGQLSRALLAAGVGRVVGAEPSGLLRSVARRRGGGPVFVGAQVEALPFADASFDAVLCCLVLEHITDLDGAVGEIARVLRVEGSLALFLNHPLLQAPDSGWIADNSTEPPSLYWRIGSYLGEAMGDEELDDGVFVPLVHRPLNRYVNALGDAGLAVTRMLEPPPAPGLVERHPVFADGPDIPRLLYLRAVKRAAG